LVSKTIIDLKDSKGNTLQYHTLDGVYTTFIYGYNYSTLLAKIQNATYSQVMAALPVSYTTLQGLDSVNDESTLQSYFSTVRNALPSAYITSYSFIPSVGVSTITDARGKTLTYVYDKFNRLSLIKDPNDNIVKRYEYHYINQQ